MTTTHERSREFAVEVVSQLRKAGHQALWAGGCVRDHLVGRTPKDYDVATDARPRQVRDLFGHRQTIPVGQAFGVITVLGPREAAPIEVATFRQDVGYSDGRHPDAVRFCDPREDAQRRDFTINGLFFDPLSEEVIDYVGGQADLQAGIVRAIGDPHQRFEEDRLRMLRAVRFATDFAFELESKTLAAIRGHAPFLVQVSAERITNELRRMLAHPRRARAVELLNEAQLWAAFPPSLGTPLQDSGDRLAIALECLAALSWSSFPAALALLVAAAEGRLDDGAPFDEDGDTASRHELSRRMADLAEQMRLSNQERDAVIEALNALHPIVGTTESTWPEVQPFLVGPYARDCIEVAPAAACRHSHWRAGIELCNDRLSWPYDRLNPRPLIDGGDLKRLGLKPGPAFAQWLGAVRREQLLERIDSRAAALAWLEAAVASSSNSRETPGPQESSPKRGS